MGLTGRQTKTVDSHLPLSDEDNASLQNTRGKFTKVITLSVAIYRFYYIKFILVCQIFKNPVDQEKY